ncbi:MFS transporter [Acidianus sulfidivorans JP7]|uniref:MFS transporter n=1 Tax=Acidianus sulfidivorans JP7 TaxID=619593 RepID=A0A2U9IPI0_9CREN|nr:MFS transporter [Acidianus sulfidivorans]AWR97887.1 MFS transporter [Acidianus sulfidivorans JP7]
MGFFDEMGFKYLVVSRILRSVGLIFITLSASLYLSLLHFSPALIGLVFAGVIAFSSSISLALGFIGDRIGYKKILLIGDSFAVVGVFLLAISSSPLLIIMALIISGISGSAGGMRGLFSTGLTALVMSNWPDERERVTRMAVLTSVASISSVGGSLMLTFHDYLPVSPIESYRILFFVSFLMLLVSQINLLFLKERPRPKKTSKVLKKSSLSYSLKVIVSNSLAGFGIGIAIPLLPLWFSLRFHMPSSEIGLVFTMSYISTSLGSFLATRISFESLKVASITRILNGVFLVLMALSPISLLSALIYIIRGFNAGLGAPNRTAVNIRGISSEDYGTASSLQGVATRFSQLSSGLGGYLMEVGLPLPEEIGGIIQAIGGFAYLKLLRKRGGKEKREENKEEEKKKEEEKENKRAL